MTAWKGKNMTNIQQTIYQLEEAIRKGCNVDPMWLTFLKDCQEKGIKNDTKAFEAFMSQHKAA